MSLRCIVDLFIISETKLDESVNDNLFSVDGYKVQRRDMNQYGGGLLTFIRSHFPSSRKQSLKSETIETDSSSFVSEIMNKSTMLSVRTSFISSNLYRRLLMFRCAAMIFLG
jgi:hypothetical protein